MKTVKELVEHLNALEIVQNDNYEYCIPSDIWMKYFKDAELVTEEIEPDKHRHFVTSIDVYKILDGYIGLRSVTCIFSEEAGFEDIDWELHFMEMEPVQETTYKVKQED